MEPPQPRPGKLKILVPTNFSRRSALALEQALSWGGQGGAAAEIFLFHSYDDKTTDFRQIDKVNEECVARMKAAVMEAIDTLGRRGITHAVDTVHRRLSYGKPWQEILKVAGGIGVDLIIMGSPNGTAFAKLIDRAPCTLVLVKDKDSTFVMD